MNSKISIIVPVYNVENYLRKCLDSLINQDYDNYEILVINDGSPDNSQNIINEYTTKYNIIRSFEKENGGYGSVLELGIKEAQGEYILVCDSDDYLESNCLSVLYNNAITSNSDISIGAKYLLYSDIKDREYDKSFNEQYGYLLDGDNFKKDDPSFRIFYFVEPSPHAKLYKKTLLLDITFLKKTSFTDNILYFCALTKANSAVYSNKALSNYLIDREGNTKTDKKPTTIDQEVNVYSHILKIVKEVNPIFYYRMYESFLYIFYLVEDIKGNKIIKKQKYDLVYTLLVQLMPYKEQILKSSYDYNLDNTYMKRIKKLLLTKESSKKTYDELVEKKLNNNIFSKIMRTIK